MNGYADDTDYQGDLSYDTRLKHIRFTLADICVKSDRTSFSFFRILNRAIILFQEPLCFAICRLRSANFELAGNTIGDPLYRNEFEQSLENLGFDLKTGKAPVKKLAEFAIPLLASSQVPTTDFHILAFKIDRSPAKADQRKQKITYLPIRKSDHVGLVLSDIFRPFGKALRTLGVDAELQNHFEQIVAASKVIQARMDDPGPNPATAEVLSVMKRYEHKALTKAPNQNVPEGRADFISLDELLQREVEEPLGSPLLYRSGQAQPQVANLILSRKRFDRQDVRFGAYFYSIDFFLSNDQKNQFLKCAATIDPDSVVAFSDAPTRQWFWKTARSKHPVELLDALSKPMSKGVRLFPEYVLMSGAAIINKNPFERGDIGWMDNALTLEERQQELRRIAVLHYLLQFMSPGVTSPSLLTLPLRVSGATWMAATFVVSGEPDPAEIGPICTSEEFQKRFLIYHSLMRSFESRLRRKSKEAYIKAVFDIFALHIDRKRKAAGGGTKNVTISPDYKELVMELTALSRVYPYDTIHFGPDAVLQNSREYAAASLGQACKVDFGIRNGNPFFDRSQLRSFLDPSEVREQLRDLIHAEVGLDVAIPNFYLKVVK